MSLNDRVGEWMIRSVIGPVAFWAVRLWGRLAPEVVRSGPDPLEVKPYRVVAPLGIVINGEFHEANKVIWIRRDIGRANSGSLEPVEHIETHEVMK